jgi:hypothetical protein
MIGIVEGIEIYEVLKKTDLLKDCFEVVLRTFDMRSYGRL